MFMVLPEHVSNAHNIWNYALLISQISNLNNYESSSSLFRHKPINRMATIADNAFRKDNKEYNALQSFIDDLQLNDPKQDYQKLNHEAILTMLNIKKQNKSSLFNLILSPTMSTDDSRLNSQNLNTSTTFISSTPWLSREKLSMSEKNKKKMVKKYLHKIDDSDSSYSSMLSFVQNHETNNKHDSDSGAHFHIVDDDEEDDRKTPQMNDNDDVSASIVELGEEIYDTEIEKSDFANNQGCKR